MGKVYALFHDAQKLEMKISCEKHWEKQAELIEHDEKAVFYWNNNIFISLSRSALVKKANEIKNEWLQKQYEAITKILNIELGR